MICRKRNIYSKNWCFRLSSSFSADEIKLCKIDELQNQFNSIATTVKAFKPFYLYSHLDRSKQCGRSYGLAKQSLDRIDGLVDWFWSSLSLVFLASVSALYAIIFYPINKAWFSLFSLTDSSTLNYSPCEIWCC